MVSKDEMLNFKKDNAELKQILHNLSKQLKESENRLIDFKHELFKRKHCNVLFFNLYYNIKGSCIPFTIERAPALKNDEIRRMIYFFN